ncbi:MAG: hypothetical protein ISS16_10400 [Ignavibacteria bacterium]|nr:hypothetical protein [Ignavibacteria bacterium]
MQTTSLVFGILAIVGMVIGFIPCLATINWLNIPFATIGLIIGIISLVKNDSPNNTSGITGIVLCSIAVIFGLIRLIISLAFGGGAII